jgi:hypothetical protein
MSAESDRTNFTNPNPDPKTKKYRNVCGSCGEPMRIRLTGPEILEGNRQTAIYVCECGHEQSYIESCESKENSGPACT